MSDFQTDVRRALGQLDEMDRAIRNNLLPAARAGGDILVREAKHRAPVRTGDLRDSIDQRDDKVTRDSASVMVFTGVWYADAVEKSPGRNKRPYMRPAIDSKRDEISDAMGDTISDAVRRGMKMRYY